MCGIVGAAGPRGSRLSLDAGAVAAMRDRLSHRGPDGATLWTSPHVALAHRRLTVVGLGPEADQPMLSPDGRHVLIYNGELYNDADLRRELANGDRAGSRGAGRGSTRQGNAAEALAGAGSAVGTSVSSTDGSHTSDTRTVLRTLADAADAADASPARPLSRLRGMYALAWHDRVRQRLTIARDPLGIKPLYYWRSIAPAGHPEIAFASEIPALLAHPRLAARPDWAVVSAYLTTIRTTLGARTLFQDVRTLLPGEWIEFDLTSDRLVERRGVIDLPRVELDPRDHAAAIARVREAVGDSVERHLRSDVPLCALLSGGVDSTIIAGIARPHLSSLSTYCAGASPAAVEAGADQVLRPGVRATDSPDFEFARQAAVALGSDHTDVHIGRPEFLERWTWMVDRLRLPLSTPNEVAIYQVAHALRARSHVVALTGEGADELFGGYDRLLSAAARWVASRSPVGGNGVHGGTAAGDSRIDADPGVHALDTAAWVPRASKPGFFRPAMWEAIEQDAALVETYRDTMGECFRAAGTEVETPDTEAAMQGFMRHQRQVNLAGLLARLDTSTMLAGVEGRTPLADAHVAALAESLPMSLKFASAGVAASPAGRALPLRPVQRPEASTKIALRRAFADIVPGPILRRAKASFPLPFEQWMSDAAAILDRSTFLESIFERPAIDLVRADPARSWNLAWPMLNLAMWGRTWD